MIQVPAQRPALDDEQKRLRSTFLKWQCRVRQLAMREAFGRPDDGVMPHVLVAEESEPRGQIITVMSKSWLHSKTPELQHMAKRTNDPAQRREKAIEFFSSTYYQKAEEFSDILTAVFRPQSSQAGSLADLGECRLRLEAYTQRFELRCSIERLEETHPLYKATWWHNLLFNPALEPNSTILAFTPDWSLSLGNQTAAR